jgi:hypothetical protein
VDIPSISSTDTLTNKTMSGASNTFTNLPVGTTGITAIANGGTAVSALPTVQGASAFAAWDANQNLSANNIVNNYTTTATAAGTTTLTVASKINQFFTGATTQNCDLPVAATLALGHQFRITNLSTGVVTVRSSGANTVIAMQPQDSAIITCILASGTSAASWSVDSELSANSATGALGLPAGTAAQRPTAVAGQVRLNTDSNSFEGYANGIWSSIGGGLNELPQKNYLKTYSEANVAPSYAGSTIAVGGNLVDLVSFHRSNSSNTITSSASTLLRGSNNYLTSMADTNSTGTAFIQFPSFALEGTDLGKPISISFDVNGVTADGNWDVVVVRYTSAGVYGSIISVAGNASSGTTPVSAKLPTGTTTFNGFFVPDSTTASDVYCVRLRHLVSNAAIRVDTLFVGSQPIRVGAAITDWQSYTPTFTGFGTASNVGFLWRRNGDSVDIAGVVQTGTSTAVTPQITLPTGLTVDTTKIMSTIARVGEIKSDAITRNNFMAIVGGAYTTSFTVAADNTPNTVVASASATFGTGTYLKIQATIPITGWSSNVTMADRAVEEFCSNSDVTSTASVITSGSQAGIDGVQFSSSWAVGTAYSRNVDFSTAYQPNDTVVLEIKDNNRNWVPAQALFPPIRQGSNNFGIQWYTTAANPNRVLVEFGAGGQTPSNATYASNGTAWSALNAAGWRWRVRKVSAGAQVGYPIDVANLVNNTPSYLAWSGQNGYGSTNTCIRKFTTATAATGTNITTANDATNGASFTVNKTGMYSIVYCDALTAGGNIGLSKNSAQLTTNIASITAANRLAIASPTANDVFACVSGVFYLTAGDVIRCHTDGSGATTSTTRTVFSMAHVTT